ncbi:MAG: TPM domain-containing protein [Rhodoferax sp.]|uniref:TPM domain-containing protein n=1 Tax=Rhodoferax sp. TaxID=50421 RepID=UPI00261D12E1|nr:TPM domain-containing protein [Rhodoferax sp.]MDD2882767.1 TPM domain-containing protein [Rhodoferax sp.]
MWTRLIRILKHRWQRDDAAQRAIPPALLDKLAAQVAKSEAGHSGEIRIYVEAGLPLSYLWRSDSMAQITHERALALFGKLRVWDTANNNGVLIYLLLTERRIEIVADRGLNQVVAPGTWPHLVASMGAAFKAGDFEGGLTQAVQAVSALLQQHFSLHAKQSNTNELPDEPVLG